MPAALLRSLFLLVPLTAFAPAFAQQLPEPMRVAEPALTVVGSGEASAAPDQALVSLTVLRAAPTARAALDEANRAMTEVIAAMREFGIGGRDLQTSGFSISPQYRYDEPRNGQQPPPPQIVGYEVRNSLSARVRAIAEVGAVLDRAVTLGVNQGGEILFTLEDPSALEAAARRAAVADARAIAETLAEASGVTLGRVLSISQEQFFAPPMPMDRAMRMAPEAAQAVPVEVGENTIHASVRMVFEIRQDQR